MEKLLDRKDFSEAVFERDGHKCVICGRNDLPLDAHHIIERRLWDDGGYYLSNGATLCDEGTDGCHYKAETTEITVEQLREACGIEKYTLPEEFYYDTVYDKWGNTFIENGMRTKGPLFDDESVQKVLQKYLSEFTNYVKYKRTYHLPWSPGITDDDRVLKDMSNFEGKEVVVTVKMDGENTNIYNDYIHARSVDGRSHYTRNWAKSFAFGYFAHNIPDKWRVCAENLYAVHSIKYDDLESYLLAFSIWNEKNECLSWDESVEWFKLLGIPHVEVLYRGPYDEKIIKGLYDDSKRDSMEGYVIRNAESFHYKDFAKNMAKFVRAGHVQTANHWMYGYNKTHELNNLKDGVSMETIIK